MPALCTQQGNGWRMTASEGRGEVPGACGGLQPGCAAGQSVGRPLRCRQAPSCRLGTDLRCKSSEPQGKLPGPGSGDRSAGATGGQMDRVLGHQYLCHGADRTQGPAPRQGELLGTEGKRV